MPYSQSVERPSLCDVQYPTISRMTDGYPALLLEEIGSESPEAQLIRENIADIHFQIGNAVTDDVAGLNLRAINEYFRHTGLKPEPYFVISTDDLALADSTLRQSFVSGLYDANGLYTPYARISLVKRDHEQERVFSRLVTERVLAHENAHSTSNHDHIQFSGEIPSEIIQNTHMPRIGNRYVPYAPVGHPERGRHITGSFAEEAFAELTASAFLMQTYVQPIEDPNIGFEFVVEDRNIWLPARHVNCIETNSGNYLTTFNTPALAAYAFELLNTIDPDHKIIELMHKGRSDVTAYLEIDQRINAMGVDNLAREMQSATYSLGGFVAGLETVEFVAQEYGIITRPKNVFMPHNVYTPDVTRGMDGLECANSTSQPQVFCSSASSL